MAIARTSAIITSISGPIGGIQFVNAKGGQRIRTRPNRRPTPTQPLIQAQSIVRQAQLLWRNLSATERRYYERLALQLTSSNALAQKTTPTAYSTFMRYWVITLSTFGTPYPDLPLAQVVNQPASVELIFTEGGPYSFESDAYTPGPNILIRIYGSPIYSRTLPAALPPFRYFALNIANSGASNIKFFWDQIFPPLRAGQWVALKLINVSRDRFPAAPAIFTTQVLAP